MNAKKTSERKRRAELPLIWIVSVAAVCAVTYLTGRGTEDLIRNAVVSAIGAGALVYQLTDTAMHRDFAYNNEEHPLRMTLVYLLCLAAAVLLPQISFLAWPYVAIYVLLALFTDALSGLYAGTYLLLLSVLLAGEGDATAFFMYLTAGAVAVVLFRHLDEDLHVGAPIFISLTVQFVLLVAYYVLFLHTELSLDLFVIPVINIGISFVLIFISTHMFAMAVIRKDSDRYMDVNDPEFPLLAAIRKTERREYFRAVHTAYLAERIAVDLGLDARAIKSCAYYHRIGILDDNVKSWGVAAHYFADFEFPQEAIALIEEYISQEGQQLRAKGTTIVMFCDTLVHELMKTFQANKDAHPDYDVMIDELFARKVNGGELTQSDISYRELERMKALLKREKLYYDFLR